MSYTNCVNCGAVLNYTKEHCEYCYTPFFNWRKPLVEQAKSLDKVTLTPTQKTELAKWCSSNMTLVTLAGASLLLFKK